MGGRTGAMGFLCTVRAFPGFPILCHALRSLTPVLFVPFLSAYTSSAVGKDGNPTGAVWRGGAHKTCSVKAR